MSENDSSEVDKQQLKEEVSHIKQAMGIEERYPGQRRMWLVHGLIIGLAGVLTNLSFAVENLPEYLYIVIWYGFVAVALVVQWRFAVKSDVSDVTSKPSWRALFGTLIAGWLASTFIVGCLIPKADIEGVVRGAIFFSITVAFFGMGYILVGNSLKAYRIQKQDRYPFYLGGAWMLIFSIFMPYVEILQYWGYALFGVLFLVHGVLSYYYLGSSSKRNEKKGTKARADSTGK